MPVGWKPLSPQAHSYKLSGEDIHALQVTAPHGDKRQQMPSNKMWRYEELSLTEKVRPQLYMVSLWAISRQRYKQNIPKEAFSVWKLLQQRDLTPSAQGSQQTDSSFNTRGLILASKKVVAEIWYVIKKNLIHTSRNIYARYHRN